MQTHEDRDFSDRQGKDFRDRFMRELEGRAELTRLAGRSQITGGAPGERAIEEWESNGVTVRKMPDDPQDILRISIGGGKHLPVTVNYCVFRGNRGACIDMLRNALAALESENH